jgi:hypothetical protein
MSEIGRLGDWEILEGVAGGTEGDEKFRLVVRPAFCVPGDFAFFGGGRFGGADFFAILLFFLKLERFDYLLDGRLVSGLGFDCHEGNVGGNEMKYGERGWGVRPIYYRRTTPLLS